MTPPSNAGGEGREVLAREVLAEHLHGFGELRRAILSGDDVTGDPMIGPAPAIAAMLAFSARENADDRAPALVEAAVAEALEAGTTFILECNSAWACGEPPHRVRAMLKAADAFQAALDRLPTPSQEACNVG